MPKFLADDVPIDLERMSGWTEARPGRSNPANSPSKRPREEEEGSPPGGGEAKAEETEGRDAEDAAGNPRSHGRDLSARASETAQLSQSLLRSCRGCCRR